MRYLLPPGAEYRFGLKPQTDTDFRLFERWRDIDKTRLPLRYRTLIVDCYDNCLAYLDERLGELFDELQRRGVLDRTLVIVTADHGEGLGEHDLFDHGESLYRAELRVPLLIVLPAQPASRRRSRNRQPARPVGDHHRSDRARVRFSVPGSVAGRALARSFLDRRFPFGRRGPLRARGSQSSQSQSRSIAGGSRPAGLPGRGGFRLHPQRSGWTRGVVRRVRRPARVNESGTRRWHATPGAAFAGASRPDQGRILAARAMNPAPRGPESPDRRLDAASVRSSSHRDGAGGFG